MTRTILEASRLFLENGPIWLPDRDSLLGIETD